MSSKDLIRIPIFDTIGKKESKYVLDALKGPLSGYLGGETERGYYVERLESEWSAEFNVNHSIACNSATSGLYAACRAAGITHGDLVWVTAYSMSATAACAYLCGAKVKFIDIEFDFFSMNMNEFRKPYPKAIIVSNIFGHPAYLSALRSWCDTNKVVMIEDNAQSPFAKEGSLYAGTIGHMGVFSFNVHKHIQSGEGGMVCTNDEELAERVFDVINHGECRGGLIGMNLRMPELCAAVMCAQLEKARPIIDGRIEIAESLTEAVKDIPFIKAPLVRPDCRHVYYVWAAKVHPGKRNTFVSALNDYCLPMNTGYNLLHKIFNTKDKCPVAEDVESCLIMFEVCSYSPSKKQLITMKDVIHEVARFL